MAVSRKSSHSPDLKIKDRYRILRHWVNRTIKENNVFNNKNPDEINDDDLLALIYAILNDGLASLLPRGAVYQGILKIDSVKSTQYWSFIGGEISVYSGYDFTTEERFFLIRDCINMFFDQWTLFMDTRLSGALLNLCMAIVDKCTYEMRTDNPLLQYLQTEDGKRKSPIWEYVVAPPQ